MSGSTLRGEGCLLRPYRIDDVDDLVAVADDPLVTRWMTHAFPSPYRRADGEAWVKRAVLDDPPLHYVIEAGGRFAGAIGLLPQAGEHDGVALFGYWLGRAFWGRGLATDAARTLARHALDERGFRRLEASVFAPNVASARVLEKASFRLEGRMRAAYVERDGRVCDALLYARLSRIPEN